MTVVVLKSDGQSSVRVLGEGERWVSIDVKLCSAGTTGPLQVSRFAGWSLSTDDGTRYESANKQDFGMPRQPVFPTTLELASGRCTRGWIPFIVPKASKLSLVDFAFMAGYPGYLSVTQQWTWRL